MGIVEDGQVQMNALKKDLYDEVPWAIRWC